VKQASATKREKAEERSRRQRLREIGEHRSLQQLAGAAVRWATSLPLHYRCGGPLVHHLFRFFWESSAIRPPLNGGGAFRR
jgi:hypothetical protein